MRFRIWSGVLVQMKGFALVPAVDEGSDLGYEVGD